MPTSESRLEAVVATRCSYERDWSRGCARCGCTHPCARSERVAAGHRCDRFEHVRSLTTEAQDHRGSVREAEREHIIAVGTHILRQPVHNLLCKSYVVCAATRPRGGWASVPIARVHLVEALPGHAVTV